MKLYCGVFPKVNGRASRHELPAAYGVGNGISIAIPYHVLALAAGRFSAMAGQQPQVFDARTPAVVEEARPHGTYASTIGRIASDVFCFFFSRFDAA